MQAIKRILIIVAALMFAAIGWVVWQMRPITYDTDDPDYAYLSEAYRDGQIELSKLSVDEWKRICFFGGYTYPQKHVAKFGGSLSQRQIRELNAKDRWFRIGAVEEHEALVAIIFSDESVRLIHLEDGGKIPSQHAIDCVDSDQEVWPENRVR